MATFWGLRALQIRSFLLQIAAQDALCAVLRLKLQTAPGSGGFGPVSGLSWGLLRGFWQGPCPADSQFLLPSLGQDMLCTGVRFKLQPETDSGYLGPVLRVSLRALFWGSWHLLSPTDSQISAAKPCVQCALRRLAVCLRLNSLVGWMWLAMAGCGWLVGWMGGWVGGWMSLGGGGLLLDMPASD